MPRKAADPKPEATENKTRVRRDAVELFLAEGTKLKAEIEADEIALTAKKVKFAKFEQAKALFNEPPADQPAE